MLRHPPHMGAPIGGHLRPDQPLIQCSFVFDITAAHSSMAHLLGKLCSCTVKSNSKTGLRKCLLLLIKLNLCFSSPLTVVGRLLLVVGRPLLVDTIMDSAPF